MIDVKELRILNRKDCLCGKHEFTLKDVKSVEQLQDAHGFYGNLVKHYAKVKCPKCGRETMLLLKQAGQTWEIMNTATTESINTIITQKKETDTRKIQAKTENKEETKTNNEFICPVCKKVCKSKIGLNAHMKTHNK